MKVNDHGKKITKTFLHDINHSIRPGSVVAIMGPSGAGKTTLLDILANRNKTGTVSGKILLDGLPISSDFPRLTGYVFQDDVLMSTMTVRECITFSANLRLPDTMSTQQKKQRVEQTMEELGISHIADRKIGDSLDRGISGGEKRRVSIGMELVISPHIIFLDEPTSGLDSASAFSVMKTITDLSKRGRTVVFSIHQPRSNIFATFHDLILLSKGRIAYAGPAHQAEDYFVRMGYQIPPHTNPADFLVDVLTEYDKNKGVDSVTTIVDERAPLIVPNNVQYQNTVDGYGYQNNVDGYGYQIPQPIVYHQQMSPAAASRRIVRHPYATSFYSQLSTLSSRAFTNFYRNFYLMPVHYLSAIIMGVLLGCIYYKLDIDLAAVQNRLGSLFFMCCILCFGAMSSLELFITERAIFVRERANGYYRPLAYFISKTLFDLIPLRLVPPVLMGSIAYFMIDLRRDTPSDLVHFGYFILILTIFNLASGALCIAVGSIAPSVASGNIIATISILTSSLFSGFVLNKGSIPYYLSWIKYLSFWNYTFEALCINELKGVTVIINPKGLPRYLADGEFWLRELVMDSANFYYDIIILSGFAVGFLILSCLLMMCFVREKR